MEVLGEFAIMFLCIAGGVYSFRLLRDCLVHQKPRAYIAESARGKRHEHSEPRLTSLDWYCQMLAAVLFLAVAAGLLVVVWRDSQLVAHISDGRQSDLSPSVQVPGVLPLPPRSILHDMDRPGQPIWGADLAFRPVTDDDIRALVAESKEIEFLVLTGTPVTDNALPYLQQLPRLEDICLGGTQITNLGCGELGQIATLQTLDLSNTEISDDGLEYLTSLSKLRFLGLRNTAVTDASVRSLLKMRHLTSLNVCGTQITEKGIQRLKTDLPYLDAGAGLQHD